MAYSQPETIPLEPLRDALRAGETRAIQRAAEPLVRRYAARLLAYSDRLIASAGRRLPVESEDLVQDAWLAALRRLTGDTAPTTEVHLYRLLRCTIRTRFLDHLERRRRSRDVDLDAPQGMTDGAPVSLVDTLVARERADSEVLFGADGALLPIVEAVFAGDEALLALCGRRPKRRAPHYQALVLFHLAEMRRDLSPEDLYAIALLQRWIRLLGVPDALWLPVEATVEAGGDDAAVLEAINGLCRTQVHDRATLSVLRYELNRLARPTAR